MRSTLTILTSGALALALMQSGCGTSTTNGTSNRGLLGSLGQSVAGLASAAGANTTTAGAVLEGVHLASAVMVEVVAQRQATEAERETAQQQASDQLKDVPENRRQEMKESNTHVAVTVGQDEAAGHSHVMVVDPVTNEPVDDTVYVIDSKDQNVESGSKVNIGGYDSIYVD